MKSPLCASNFKTIGEDPVQKLQFFIGWISINTNHELFQVVIYHNLNIWQLF